MSQLMHWDNAKLVAEAHQRDLQHLAKPLQPADKPIQREPGFPPPQRNRLSVVMAIIVAISKR